MDLDAGSILTRLEMTQIIQTMAEKLTDKEVSAIVDELYISGDGEFTFSGLIDHMFSDSDEATNY